MAAGTDSGSSMCAAETDSNGSFRGISMRKAFFEEVYSVVAQIPEGKVLSYGQVAALAGRPRNARMVGQAMWCAPEELALPCHRVVNSMGRVAPACPEHRQMLALEGVTFRRNGCVDMTKHGWKIDS